MKDQDPEDTKKQEEGADNADDGIHELVVHDRGFNISVYIYDQAKEELVLLMDQWPYGAAGNPGYEYIDCRNVIRIVSAQQAGTMTYYAYYMMENGEVFPYFGDISVYTLHHEDKNGNGVFDAGETYSADPVAYFVNGQEVSKDEFTSYQVAGDYKPLMGEKTLAELKAELD